MKDYVIVILPSYNTMYYYHQPVTNAATATARTRRGLGIRGVVPPPLAARQVCARALGDRSASPRRLRFPGANAGAPVESATVAVASPPRRTFAFAGSAPTRVRVARRSSIFSSMFSSALPSSSGGNMPTGLGLSTHAPPRPNPSLAERSVALSPSARASASSRSRSAAAADSFASRARVSASSLAASASRARARASSIFASAAAVFVSAFAALVSASPLAASAMCARAPPWLPRPPRPRDVTRTTSRARRRDFRLGVARRRRRRLSRLPSARALDAATSPTRFPPHATAPSPPPRLVARRSPTSPPLPRVVRRPRRRLPRRRRVVARRRRRSSRAPSPPSRASRRLRARLRLLRRLHRRLHRLSATRRTSSPRRVFSVRARRRRAARRG